MTSLIQWTWTWTNCGRWGGTGKPSVLKPGVEKSRTRLGNWTIMTATARGRNVGRRLGGMPLILKATGSELWFVSRFVIRAVYRDLTEYTLFWKSFNLLGQHHTEWQMWKITFSYRIFAGISNLLHLCSMSKSMFRRTAPGSWEQCGRFNKVDLKAATQEGEMNFLKTPTGKWHRKVLLFDSWVYTWAHSLPGSLYLNS